jgi:hypothetical protein
MAAKTDRSDGERREMIKVIGKPSRLKDGIGVAALAGTALLYAFQGSDRQQTDVCLGCEISEVTPAVDAAPVTAASHLLEKAHLQREAH